MIDGILTFSFACPTCHNEQDEEIHSFDALDLRFSENRKVLIWDDQCVACHEILSVKMPA